MKKQKMMQVNVLEIEGKLTINMKRKDFSNTEVIGILDLAKSQIKRGMKMNIQEKGTFKKDDEVE
jgi:hypothetical protein